jgi:hypothetical protein
MTTTRSLIALALVSVTLNFVASVEAFGSSRVFLSAATGNDTSVSCTSAAPCRNLPRALAVVSPGGQIVLMDSGGYGGAMSVALTFAVQIVAPDGVQAMLTDNPTNYGAAALITVAAGSSDLVLLRGLQIDGVTKTGTGILHQSGRLVVDHCTFTQLAVAISAVNSKMDIVGSSFAGNAVAVSSSGSGTEYDGSSTTSVAQVRISSGSIVANDVALKMTDPGDGLANIFIQIVSNSLLDWTTNITGNTTTVLGVGNGCSSPCPTGSYGGGGFLH